jgi:hypothetical protein
LDQGDDFSATPTTDQRGFTRPVDFASVGNASGGDGSDIGAYERQSIGPSAVNGQLIISEFRLHGPQGPTDEFIEIYNNTDSAHTVSPVSGTGYSVAASDGVVRCVIPEGTVIPARGHFLCVNSNGYSLSGYPASNLVITNVVNTQVDVPIFLKPKPLGSNPLKPSKLSRDVQPQAVLPPSPFSTATGDATYTTNIPDNMGIALFRTSVPADFGLSNRLDAVGSSSETNALYREGNGYAPITGLAVDYSFVRDECGKGGSITTFGPCSISRPKDTNENDVDFILVETSGMNLGAGQRLGAPGPENLSSPIQRNSTMPGTLLDNSQPASSPPNRARDFTSDPLNNSTFGTLDLRRRVVNNTGGDVTRLRFRVIDITTFFAPSGIADLRPRSSGTITVSGINDAGTCPGGIQPCTVTVRGTTLEQPPSQPNGGGFNSSMSADTVTLTNPLPPGTSINVRFLLGIQQTGSFRFIVNIEALP